MVALVSAASKPGSDPFSHEHGDGMERTVEPGDEMTEAEADAFMSRASIQCAGGYHFLCRDPRCICPTCGHGREDL